MKMSNTTIAAALFFAAFALSGFWILFNPQKPLPDTTLYEGIGANLAAGNGYSFDLVPPYRPELTRMPFLPALIAVVYKIVGRTPQVVLWFNAVLIGSAVAMGYLVALRIFRDRRVAVAGSILALLTPQVTGAANNILTEPPAMLQIALLAWLLLGWKERRDRLLAPLEAALLGLLLAGLVLNRGSFAPVAIAAGLYAAFTAIRGRWRHARSYLSLFLLAASLGVPVLLWSARNASLGLPFNPAPIGVSASRVFDIGRYKGHLLEKGERLPEVNALYFSHWKRRFGPEELFRLEEQNKRWLDSWLERNAGKAAKAAPARLLGLFSDFRISIWPPWNPRHDRTMWKILRWVSRSLWLLSFAGMLMCWKHQEARWMWLTPMVLLISVHLMTVCHPRYLIPLMPLLMPYGGVVLVRIWDSIRFYCCSKEVRK